MSASPVALCGVALGCEGEHVPLTIKQEGGGVGGRHRAGAWISEARASAPIESHPAI